MSSQKSRPGVLAIPKDPNPYQELLYSRMRHLGHRIRYLGELTRSHSLNLLLLPLEIALCRIRGYRVVHLHWTFGFTFAGAASMPVVQRLSRYWFQLVMWWARAIGLRLVWTVHNVLPHAQVFDDDRAARRFLVRQADLLIAHSAASLSEVEAYFGEPRRSAVIAHGPSEPPGLADIPLLTGAHPRTILFFGLIEPYKGVEDLLHAVAEVECDLSLHIAGRCRDSELASTIRRLAEPLPSVTLTLGFVPDAEVPMLFTDADAVVFPYRRATTSGVVTLAAAAGRPIIVPELPAFDSFSTEAAIRYPPGVAGLKRALEEIAAADTEQLLRMGQAAKQVVVGVSWDEIAQVTSAAVSALFERGRGARGQPTQPGAE